VKVIK